MSDADTARQPTDISQSFFRTTEAKVGVAQTTKGPGLSPVRRNGAGYLSG